MQNKPYFFFGNRGSQKGGRGGGPTLGKNSQKIPFFLLGASLTPHIYVGEFITNIRTNASQIYWQIPHEYIGIYPKICWPMPQKYIDTYLTKMSENTPCKYSGKYPTNMLANNSQIHTALTNQKRCERVS